MRSVEKCEYEQSSSFSLRGQIAVVTGASRGIGLEIARGLASAGADIVGVSARMPTGESDTRTAVESEGRLFTPTSCDFSVRREVGELAAHLTALEPDILVNNAGTIRRAPAIDYGDDDWDFVIDVNLRSQFVLSRELRRGFLDRGYGRVIFVASVLSFQGGIDVAAYTASKSAVAGLTRALANEWAVRNVTVNAIAPGYIATENTEALRADPERYAAITARIPVGRWGAAADVVGATVFLASPAAQYVTGIVLPVDGGWLAR